MSPTFDELGLTAEMMQAIDALGYEEPTPIQAATIPLLLAGRDVIAQAQTGTGKTAAYAIPLLQRLHLPDTGVQTVVIVPTRELAIQVAEAIHDVGRGRDVGVLPIYGGQAYDRQLRALRAGVPVVVGTPGRMLDHIRRGTLQLDGVRTIVLDEADEMLSMGFREDIEFLLEQAPAERQMALFSATISPPVERLARRFMRDPERITIEQDVRSESQTRQFYLDVPYRSKPEALGRILDLEAPQSAIIFCRTKREVDDLSEWLQAFGYAIGAIHGDISQAQRERVLTSFRENRVELLIATDVAARGLDIPDVTHVINFDIPDDGDAYVHRIGRTGRMGRKGEAVTFVTPREFGLLHLIERQIHHKLKPLRLPTTEDIEARRREEFRNALLATIASGAASQYSLFVEQLADERDPLEIAAAAVHLALARPSTEPREPRAEGGLQEAVVEPPRPDRPRRGPPASKPPRPGKRERRN